MFCYAKHQHEPGPGECRPQPTLQARRKEAKKAKSARAKTGCRISASGPARRKATQRVNDRMKLHFSHNMLFRTGVTSLQYTLINCCKCIRSMQSNMRLYCEPMAYDGPKGQAAKPMKCHRNTFMQHVFSRHWAKMLAVNLPAQNTFILCKSSNYSSLVKCIWSIGNTHRESTVTKHQ